jgi:hypothetical protein
MDRWQIRKKLEVKGITACSLCPGMHSVRDFVDDCGYINMCIMTTENPPRTEEGREIDDIHSVPDWCPLPEDEA